MNDDNVWVVLENEEPYTRRSVESEISLGKSIGYPVIAVFIIALIFASCAI